jgi:hypothetical protein
MSTTKIFRIFGFFVLFDARCEGASSNPKQTNVTNTNEKKQRIHQRHAYLRMRSAVDNGTILTRRFLCSTFSVLLLSMATQSLLISEFRGAIWPYVCRERIVDRFNSCWLCRALPRGHREPTCSPTSRTVLSAGSTCSLVRDSSFMSDWNSW